MISTMQCGEKIEKFKSDLINSLDSFQDIGVASRFKAILELTKVKAVTTIDINSFEGLFDDLASDLG